ncbi:MAG TPA: FtsX-like permease family protein, partial [Streptosporangiaceae bacterium]|nr:FtsX-like permease family protein [Streptosporangiaceae bacterium]
MSTETLERPARAANGGAPARRAVTRWGWRLFRREWRQQLMVLLLIIVAVAATIVVAAVSTNNPPPANSGFGNAKDMATFQVSGAKLASPDSKVASEIAALKSKVGTVDVIENQTMAIPGSIDTYQLRAQNAHGPYGQPLLKLTAGHFPTGPGQVAVTSGVASAFRLKIGSTWTAGGKTRRVVGLVENPESLLDEFALVTPGQVSAPTLTTVLFDAPRGVKLSSLGPTVQSVSSQKHSNIVNPETITVAGVTVGMLLIALVAIGGFTVLAQRRLRSLGMLASLGATPRRVAQVVRVNGAVVGLVGAAIGFVLGMGIWFAYRPELEQSSHHTIGAFALPWLVIVLSVVLAVAATYFAASRPARAIARIPVVTALSGRPPEPRKVHRSAIPGLVMLVIAFIMFGLSGANAGGGSQSTPLLELAVGLILLIVSITLLAPLCLTLISKLGPFTPVAVRLALRDLSRYRARSGSALAAISVGIVIATIISVVSAARFANVLDYTGPNVASNQFIIWTPNGQGGVGSGPGGPTPVKASAAQMLARAHQIASSLGSHEVVPLDGVGANLNYAAAGSGRNWNGPLYTATPQLLHAFGITRSQINPKADILTMRPGMSTMSRMQLLHGNGNGKGGPPPGSGQFPCPKSSCLANPVIQEMSSLPGGTSAPNTVITEHAVREFHLQPQTVGWFVQTPNPPTATQITNAKLSAAQADLTIETRSSIPTSATIVNWATAFGIVLALVILAMSIGLIRSEAASDLRILEATGASGVTRRTLTAATA